MKCGSNWMRIACTHQLAKSRCLFRCAWESRTRNGQIFNWIQNIKFAVIQSVSLCEFFQWTMYAMLEKIWWYKRGELCIVHCIRHTTTNTNTCYISWHIPKPCVQACFFSCGKNRFANWKKVAALFFPVYFILVYFVYGKFSNFFSSWPLLLLSFYFVLCVCY